MKLLIDIPEKYYKDAKRMVWSSTYSGSLISGWLRNAIPVKENGGRFVTDDEISHECMWDSKYEPRK